MTATTTVRYVPDEDSKLMPQLLRERAARAEAGVQHLPVSNAYRLTAEEAAEGERLNAAVLWSRGAVPVSDLRTRQAAIVWRAGNVPVEGRPDAREAMSAYLAWEMRLWGIQV